MATRKQMLSTYLGNLFEHYDTALFGFLSPFFASLIFPHQDPLTALILTYALIPLGMLARPLGSLVFGYLGDLYGRQHALFLTLAGMSIVSGCIALSPTYAQVGMLAPLIFLFGRILQNFLAAGETMGGAIYLLESTAEKKHDVLSGLYSASTIGGHLLASLGVFVISYYNTVEMGWRILYILGCLTGIFGCMIRQPMHATPTTKLTKSTITFSQTLSNLKNAFWNYRQPLIFIMIGAGFAHANYSMALVLMNGFIPLITPLTKTDMMQINTYLLVMDLCLLPIFGWIASKVDREKLMLTAAFGVILFAIPLTLSLQGASLFGVIGARIAFVLFGVAFFAPFHAWAQRLIPAEHRYAVISLGYALGSQLLGSPTAALSLWLYQQTGMISSVAWYWMFLASASFVVLLAGLRIKNTEVIEKELT